MILPTDEKRSLVGILARLHVPLVVVESKAFLAPAAAAEKWLVVLWPMNCFDMSGQVLFKREGLSTGSTGSPLCFLPRTHIGALLRTTAGLAGLRKVRLRASSSGSS